MKSKTCVNDPIEKSERFVTKRNSTKQDACVSFQNAATALPISKSGETKPSDIGTDFE